MKKLLLTLLLLFLFPTLTFGASVKIQWKPNSESDLAGYKVYYGTAHRTYAAPIDVGNVTTYEITGLSAGTYYIAITAYDTSGNESDYSYEVVPEVKVKVVEGLEIIE